MEIVIKTYYSYSGKSQKRERTERGLVSGLPVLIHKGTLHCSFGTRTEPPPESEGQKLMLLGDIQHRVRIQNRNLSAVERRKGTMATLHFLWKATRLVPDLRPHLPEGKHH